MFLRRPAPPVFPPERIKTVDDLLRKWREVQAGLSTALLLDVREPGEFASCRIAGSFNLPLSQMQAAPALLPDRQAELWLWCNTHNRAPRAGQFLLQAGYENLYVVAGHPDGTPGGVAGWTRRGYPLDCAPLAAGQNASLQPS